jgi:hypothetical protein
LDYSRISQSLVSKNVSSKAIVTGKTVFALEDIRKVNGKLEFEGTTLRGVLHKIKLIHTKTISPEEKKKSMDIEFLRVYNSLIKKVKEK